MEPTALEPAQIDSFTPPFKKNDKLVNFVYFDFNLDHLAVLSNMGPEEN